MTPIRLPDIGIAVLLCLSGAVTGVLSIAFLPIHVGSTPLPLSAVVGAALLGLLVWVTDYGWRQSASVGWVCATVALLFSGTAPQDWRLLLYFVLGVGAAIWAGAVRKANQAHDG